MAKAKVQEQRTPNGIIKGRPGAGKVLSLGERKSCYAGHAMSKENTFRYTKPVARLENGRIDRKAHKPEERIWCRKCRAISRKGSRTRRLAEEVKADRQNARQARATVEAGMTKGRTRKASVVAPTATGGKAKAKPATRKAKPAGTAFAPTPAGKRKEARRARNVKALSTPAARADAKARALKLKKVSAPAPTTRKRTRKVKMPDASRAVIAGSASTARKAARVAATVPPSGNTAGGA